MFPTEREIYHRLRWDPRFDLRRCHIVFTLRPSGTKRVPFLDHDLDAIPWHRIIEFWIDDELAWSRPERIDRLDELAAARGAASDQLGAAPEVIAIDPHVFTDGSWQPGKPSAAGTTRDPERALRVITWNLLFDRYDAEILRSDERWQDALDRLAVENAQVIALCEVVPGMYTRILAQPWVRSYAVSHAPATPHLAPFGQVILSKLPMSGAHIIELASRRKAIAVTLEAGDRTLGVVAIHLSSDKSDDAVARREAQLGGVLAHLAATPRDAWIIAGDFNASPETFAPRLAAARAIDAWEVVRPSEPGFTFDAVANTLAAATSSTGRSTRLDRILTIDLAATATRLIGTEPGRTGHPPSDHYGVLAELSFRGAAPDLRTAPTTRRISLAIVPPADAWGAIQKVRCASERGFGRWPPHITLAHPFVDDAWLDRAVGLLRRICAEHEPFELTLERISPIEAGSRTIVMFPDRQAARAIERIHHDVRESIPDPEGARSFLAHLTVARDIDARTIAPFTVSWRVDRLTVLREDSDRFEPIHELALGGGSLPPRTKPAGRYDDLIAQLREACQLVDASSTVEPYGSIVYAPAHARDVDLVVETELAVEQFSAELAPLADLVEAGSASHLRGTVGNVAIELSISSRLAPDERMLAGPRDGKALRQHLLDHGRHEAFLAAWPSVRQFVHARGLLGNGLGYFGSFGWAMLLAIPLCHDSVLCTSAPERVMLDWFAWLSRLELGTRVGFSDATNAHGEPLWISAPSPPSRNAARAVTRGTFVGLREEFRKVHRAAGTYVDLLADPPRGKTLAITAPDRGVYEGRFRALLGDLEAVLGPVIRPWGRFEVEGVDGSDWAHHVTVPPEHAVRASSIIESFGMTVSLA